jgi:outer membrane lipoprotein carrier protein
MAGLLLALSAPPAKAATLSDVVRTLERPFQAATPAGTRIDDYRADFAQEARIASLDRVQHARGQLSVRFEYRRSAPEPTVMFRWEYAEPTPQELVSDGKSLWVYLPENNQVIQSDLGMVSKSGESNPMTFLTGLGNLSRDFQVSFAVPDRDSSGNYVLDLRPRHTTALLNRMVIVVDQKALEPAARIALIFPILSTTVYDSSNNSTTIKFSNLRVNPGISPGTFRFTPPTGVEVVRPNGKAPGF